MSRNYNTMARLSSAQIRQTFSEYPKFKKLMIKHTHVYKDNNIIFIKECLNKVEVFKNIPKVSMFELLYGMKRLNFEHGQMILKEKEDNTSSLYIVESGCAEVYTEFEGNYFVIDRLYRGSIINHRAFLMDGIQYVNVRSNGMTYIH